MGAGLGKGDSLTEKLAQGGEEREVEADVVGWE